MRQLIGAGTPKEAAARGRVLLFVAHGEESWRCSSSLSLTPTAVATSASSSSPSPPTRHDHNGHIVNGLIEDAQAQHHERAR